MTLAADLGPRIIVALDYPDAGSALAMARRLEPGRCRVKVGKELFVSEGPAIVAALAELGHEVFLDLKFHDIPNTVAGACRAAARMGVWMVNVHAGGGLRMIAAAREALDGADARPLLIAVTVLTSMTGDDLGDVGVDVEPARQVARLAELAERGGCDGIVCSPADLRVLATELPGDFLRVTPGVRPASSAADDQRRIATPADAIADGAHYLVVGRPITAAPDPMQALAAIEREVNGT